MKTLHIFLVICLVLSWSVLEAFGAGSSKKKEKPVKKSSSKSSTLEEVSSEILAEILDDNDEVLKNCPLSWKNSYFLHWNFDWKSCFVVFFHEWNKWKNPKFNFSSQNLCIERNFFKWDGKETKILHLLFHRIWKNIYIYQGDGFVM